MYLFIYFFIILFFLKSLYNLCDESMYAYSSV